MSRSAQLSLFDKRGETRKKERALNLLEIYRRDLIDRAKTIADELASEHGEITAPMIVRVLIEEKAPGINKVDRRFMGCVFRKGWVRTGFVTEGSHRQPISKWRKK